jgi:hypothetical protein
VLISTIADNEETASNDAIEQEELQEQTLQRLKTNQSQRRSLKKTLSTLSGAPDASPPPTPDEHSPKTVISFPDGDPEEPDNWPLVCACVFTNMSIVSALMDPRLTSR